MNIINRSEQNLDGVVKSIGNKNKISNIRQEKLDPDDLDTVTKIHIEAFPDSTWTKLGSQVVKEYYRWQLTGPHPFVSAKTIYVDDNCAGFLIGGLFKASTSGFIWLNRHLLARKVLLKPWLMFDSVFRNSFNSGFRMVRKFSPDKINSEKSAEPVIISQAEQRSFGILAIAVSPHYQSHGIGKILMETAENIAVSSGFTKMDLTVNPSNVKAIKFYERLNWEKILTKGEWKGIMEKKLIV